MNSDLRRLRVGRCELIGRVDFRVELDRLNRRPCETQRFRPVTTFFYRLRL